MSSRTSSLAGAALLALLVSCKPGATPEAEARTPIHCAIGKDAQFVEECGAAIIADDQGRLVLLFRPDGGFRRARITADGHLSLADGAESALTGRDAEHVELIVGDERYMVPVALIEGRK